MDWQLVGSIALGFVVGYVAMYFLTRMTEFSLTKLAAFLAVLVGGTVLEFLVDRLEAKEAHFGAYAAGLAAGLVLYIILYWIRTGIPPARQR